MTTSRFDTVILSSSTPLPAGDAEQRVKRGPLGTGHELYGYAMDHSMRIRVGDCLIRKQSPVII
jgi:hypothetical protein